MCEFWWDLPRNIKKLFWPHHGLGLCLDWQVSQCAFTAFLVDKCPKRSRSGAPKTHNYSQTSLNPRRFLFKVQTMIDVHVSAKNLGMVPEVEVVTQWAAVIGNEFA